MVANRTSLASRARALPCITERSAYGTVTGPAEAGYEARQKNRRRNRYQTRAHLTLPEPGSQERTRRRPGPFCRHPRRP
jgi:hypothetical protein